MTKKSVILIITALLILLLTSCSDGGKTIRANSIILDRDIYAFAETGESLYLSASLEPMNATERSVIWQSSDPDVATVTTYGLVTATGEGDCIILVRTKDGKASAECRVSVSIQVDVEGLEISSKEISLNEYFGQSSKIEAQIIPEFATDKNIFWSSADPNIVTVNTDGTVTAVSNGDTVVTAVTEDGGFSQSCLVHVNVNTDIPMKDMNFDISECTFDQIGQSVVLNIVWEPEDTTNKGYFWVNSDDTVVSLDQSTGTVTAKGNGTATVYAVSRDRTKQAICKFIVNAYIPVTSVSVSPSTFTFDRLNDSVSLKTTITPQNATDTRVIYTSSDTTVATVDQNGKITAAGIGNAVITVSSESGEDIFAVSKISVSIPEKIVVSSVAVADQEHTFDSLDSLYDIKYSVFPENAENKNVSFSSSDKSVAIVSSSGTVTPTGSGIAEVTVKTEDGGFTSSVKITVNIKNEKENENEENTSPIERLTSPKQYESLIMTSDDVRAVWVATVTNVDFPSKSGLSASDLKKEIDSIVTTASKNGINVIFFQVRPAADAFYKSEIFPVSKWLTGTQGSELTLDCLDYFIQKAHENNIELHAWINPYRVLVKGAKKSVLSADNPASKHPEWCVDHSDGGYYFNPGIPEVRQLVIDGVLELIRNYDVDGIHFDDYFYPYDDASSFNDEDAFKKYNPDGLSKKDWRIQNINSLIKGVYTAIKKEDSKVAFGVSPFGIWALKKHNENGTDIPGGNESYYAIYADTRAWVLNGWLDYIAPQVYWQTTHNLAPFKPIVDWWDDLVSKTETKLLIGIAAYKGDSVDAYKKPEEIQTQLKYLNSKNNTSGFILFSYNDVRDNTAGISDTMKSLDTILLDKSEEEKIKAASESLVFQYTSITVDHDVSSTGIIGVSDPNYPVYVNGEPVTERSEHGYFSYFAENLKVGENHFKFTHKDQEVDYIVTREKEESSSTTMSYFGIIKSTCTPKYNYANASGSEVTFNCTATAGANVYVKFGNYTVPLTTDKKPQNGKFIRASYSGSFILPDIEGNAVLGDVVFYAEGDGHDTYSVEMSNSIEVINDPDNYLVRVVKDNAFLFENFSQDEIFYKMATENMIDGIVSKFNGYWKLKSGYYTHNTNVERISGTLTTSAIGGISVSASEDSRYTVISIPLSDKTMHTVWMDDDRAEIVLYNVAAVPQIPEIPDNKLFSSASVTSIDSTTVKITLKLLQEYHIFGYDSYFEGSRLIIKFKNPVPLSDISGKPLSGIRISIDSGHSLGNGATGPWGKEKYTEYIFNYDLSSRVCSILESMGATVRMSHHGELKYDLDPIIEQFKEWDPDINVSIHFNAVGEGANPLKGKGTETFYTYSNSKLLAQTMLDSFTEITQFTKRACKPGYYKVSRFTEFPSILFETAFMTNIYEYDWFTDSENMQIAAQAIADSIVKYFILQ